MASRPRRASLKQRLVESDSGGDDSSSGTESDGGAAVRKQRSQVSPGENLPENNRPRRLSQAALRKQRRDADTAELDGLTAGSDGESDDEVTGMMREANKKLEAVDQGMDEIRKTRKAKTATKRDGKAGILLTLELVNFMNHARLTLNFGPHINFIFGRNGSGKSAALTALTVVLGARAAFTGRGSGIKDLVRRGSQQATIRLTLTNEGQDAHRAAELGAKFVIERVIKASGGGSWKLKNAINKRVVGTNMKRDIQPLLDHFNYQAENPCVFLMQDTAKEFLVHSTPQKKYEFFKRSTQLSDIQDLIQRALDQAKHARAAAEHRTAQLPSMRNEVAAVRSEYEALNRLHDAQTKFKNAKRIAAWRSVYDEEQKIANAESERESTFEKAAALRATATEEAQAAKAANTAVAEAQSDLTAFQEETQSVELMIDREKQKIQALQRRDNDRVREGKRLESELERATTRLKRADTALHIAQRNAEKSTQNISERSNDKKRRAQDDLEDGQTRLNNYKRQHTEAEGAAKEASFEVQRREGAHKAAHKVVGQLYSSIENAKRAAQSGTGGIALFGEKDRRFYSVVHKQRWKKVPIGPLGLDLCVIPGMEQWAGLAEHCTKDLLRAYVVDNVEDQHTLLRLMRNEFGTAKQPAVFKMAFDRPEYNTDKFLNAAHRTERFPRIIDIVSRISTCSETAVIRAACDFGKADSIVLFRTQKEAEQQLAKPGTSNLTKGFSLDAYEVEIQGGGQIYTIGIGGRVPAASCLRPEGADMTAELERLRAASAQANAEFEAAKSALQQATLAMNREKAKLAKLDKSMKEAESTVEEARLALAEFADEEDLESFTQTLSQVAQSQDETPSLAADYSQAVSKLLDAAYSRGDVNMSSALQAVLQKIEAQEVAREDVRKCENALAQFKANTSASTEQEEAPIQKEIIRLTALKEGRDASEEEMEQKLIKLDQTEASLSSKAIASAKRAAAAEENVLAIDAKLVGLRTHLEEAIQKVRLSGVGERPAEEELEAKTFAQRHAELTTLIADVKRHEAAQAEARDAEVVRAEYQAKKGKLQQLERQMAGLDKELNRTFKAIANRWDNFKQLTLDIEIRTMNLFQYYLNKRGYAGELEFKDESEELHIRVSVEVAPSGNAAVKRAGSSALAETNTLSGGEKSFTTTALLLALWDPMDMPIRAMDEFDVFMDAINRKKALDALLEQADETLKNHGLGQFLFITPHTYSDVLGRGNVHAVRMPEPERNQSTLD